jgi:integrase
MSMLQIQPKKLEGLIRDYIIYLKQDKKLASASVSCYISCVSHFYQMNDFTDLNWKKLNKFKGKHRIMVEDVPYTRDQIKLLLERATLRDRCMILLMTSAGLRRGALPHLRVKHLSRISNFGLYRITVYKKESEEYVSYCTPECARAIDEYLEWRERLGEPIKPDSFLFRKEFDTTSPMIIARPKPITPNLISSMIMDLLEETGIRPKANNDRSRKEIMQCHGFRKFFDTQCISHNMNPLYCEYLMGHKSGLIKSYFKPTDTELLEGNDKSVGYIGVIPYLTVNATEEENERLRRQVETLQVEKSQIEDLQREMNAIRELVAVKTKASNTYQQK